MDGMIPSLAAGIITGLIIVKLTPKWFSWLVALVGVLLMIIAWQVH